MADTLRGDFKEPCSDCGDPDNTCVRHNGPLVPSGTNGSFCEDCFQVRVKDYDDKKEPRPLGMVPTV